MGQGRRAARRRADPLRHQRLARHPRRGLHLSAAPQRAGRRGPLAGERGRAGRGDRRPRHALPRRAHGGAGGGGAARARSAARARARAPCRRPVSRARSGAGARAPASSSRRATTRPSTTDSSCWTPREARSGPSRPGGSKRCWPRPAADPERPAPARVRSARSRRPLPEGSARPWSTRGADRAGAAARGLRRHARRRGARADERARAPRRARHACCAASRIPASAARRPIRFPSACAGSRAAARRARPALSGSRPTATPIASRRSTPTGACSRRPSAVALLVDHLARSGRIRRGVALSIATGSLVERIAQGHGLAVTRHPIGFRFLSRALAVGRGRCRRRRERRLRAGKLQRGQGRDPLRLSARGAGGDACARRCARGSRRSSAATADLAAVAPRSPLRAALARGAASACARRRPRVSPGSGCARPAPTTACGWSSTMASCCCAPRAPSRCCGSTPKRAAARELARRLAAGARLLAGLSRPTRVGVCACSR